MDYISTLDFNKTEGFAVLSLSIAILRCVNVYIINKLSQSSWAEKRRITKKPVITEAQRSRESVWPLGFFLDFIAMMFLWYSGTFSNLPIFSQQSLIWSLMIHCTVVELIYYWAHRALHIGWFFKRWHAYHHASIATEPTTSFSFEIGERLIYTALFAISPVLVSLLGRQSLLGLFGYIFWFDINNMIGHFNAEFLPGWYPDSPLALIWYSPSYHSIHHTRFKKNYSLFMSWPDIAFGTAELGKSREIHREAVDAARVVTPVPAGECSSHDFAFLVHPVSIQSYVHSNSYFWFFGLQGQRYDPKWYHKVSYPMLFITYVYLNYFTDQGWHVEECFNWIAGKNLDGTPRKLRGTTYVVQNPGVDFFIPFKYSQINRRICKAYEEAQKRNTRVVGLAALNKAEWLNHGGVDILKTLGNKAQTSALVHGDTMTAAVVIQCLLDLRRRNFWNKSIFMIGATSKIGRAVALALAQRQVRVYMYTTSFDRYSEIRNEAGDNGQYLIHSTSLSDGADCDLWVTGKMEPAGLKLLRAIPRGVTVVNFAVPDPLTLDQVKTRPDLLHLDGGFLAYDTNQVSMKFTHLLDPGLIYACMAGTVVHSALGLKEHEVGPINLQNLDSLWQSALDCGFTLPNPMTSFQIPVKLPEYRTVEV